MHWLVFAEGTKNYIQFYIANTSDVNNLNHVEHTFDNHALVNIGRGDKELHEILHYKYLRCEQI